MQIDFLHSVVVPQSLSEFQYANLTYFLISCQFESCEPAVFILIQPSQFQDTLISKILILQI